MRYGFLLVMFEWLGPVLGVGLLESLLPRTRVNNSALPRRRGMRAYLVARRAAQREPEMLELVRALELP